MAEKMNTCSDRVCKPSELPLYTKENRNVCKKKEVCIREPGFIENAFGSARRSLFSAASGLQSVTNLGQSLVQDAVNNASGAVTYLQQEENTTPKYGAVAVGGLTGVILGLRGGLFKRTLYGSIGALGMAALCYPKEAAEYSEIGIEEGKRYATIAYNFIYGVKKGDPPLELPSLPKLPETMSEAWDIAKNLGKSTASSVTDPDNKVMKKDDKVCDEPQAMVTVIEEILDTEDYCACPDHARQMNPTDDEDAPSPTSLEFDRVKNYILSITPNSFLSFPKDPELKRSSPTK